MKALWKIPTFSFETLVQDINRSKPEPDSKSVFDSKIKPSNDAKFFFRVLKIELMNWDREVAVEFISWFQWTSASLTVDQILTLKTELHVSDI